jgi:predicted transcriptional regulator
MSKHEEILKYIEGLSVGTKISVRSIATVLDVSDGTAYRAIKDAELLEIVSTMPRVGTVRIEKLHKKHIDHLTFTEVVNIVDGVVLGGKNGLYKTLKKFVIGAMTLDEMTKYITPGNLVIVGNREEVHMLALEKECGVLITGGFSCSEGVKSFANEKNLPIISSPYDTFTTASMINKAISQSLIKKDIIIAEDIMNKAPVFMDKDATVGELRHLSKENKTGAFPVVDDMKRLTGVVMLQDIPGDVVDTELVSRYVVKNPTTISSKTTVSYAAYIMSWENMDFIPVVDNRLLVGTVSRQEVIKTLQFASRQPQVVDTIDDMLIKRFSYSPNENGLIFYGRITPDMLGGLGTASWNAMSLLMSSAGTTTLLKKNHFNVSVDSFTVYYTKPVQVDTEVIIECNIIDMGRSFAKVEIQMWSERKKMLLGKGMLSTKFLRR